MISGIKSCYEGKRLLSVLITFLLLKTSILYSQRIQEHKLNFGVTGSLTFWPKPIVKRETGIVDFEPGPSQQFEYGIQLNYNLAKTWSIYVNYMSGAAPIVTKHTFYAKDYPKLLTNDIIIGPPPRYVDQVFYWMFQIMSEKHFNSFKKNNISISAGVSLKENTPGSFDFGSGFIDSNDVAHQLLGIKLETGTNGRNTIWALNLGVAHYFSLIRQQDLKLMLYYSHSSEVIAQGVYYIFANSEYQTTGTYKIRGHYLALNLTYLIGRNKKVKFAKESGQ
jgi:hypothetical protein